MAGSSSIFCPDHLPLASDISVGSRTSSSSTRDKECSISHQSDIILLTDLLFRQLPVLSPKHSSSVGMVSSTLLTIDKGSEGPEIAALSHIALLQGPLQGEGKGSENVDSSPTPPLSPTRAPRPASRESCGGGTMVQCLVQQAAVHHMHHAPLRGANPWFGQRQLARVPHIPSHGTMTPPNTLILRSTLRKN